MTPSTARVITEFRNKGQIFVAGTYIEKLEAMGDECVSFIEAGKEYVAPAYCLELLFDEAEALIFAAEKLKLLVPLLRDSLDRVKS